MSKPYIHAQSSARRYGGKPEDYIEIHSFMDLSKSAVADNRHRCVTHNSFFVGAILERIKFTNSCPPTGENKFPTIINSDGKHISVRDIGEDHVLEDFRMKFIPTLQDYVQVMEFKDWMNNGNGIPPSHTKIAEDRKKRAEKAAPENTLVSESLLKITDALCAGVTDGSGGTTTYDGHMIPRNDVNDGSPLVNISEIKIPEALDKQYDGIQGPLGSPVCDGYSLNREIKQMKD